MTKAQTVKHDDITSECWGIQFEGKKVCKTCSVFGKDGCVGKNIIKTGKNSKGKKVPLWKNRRVNGVHG
jgi:hypothetical protein